MKIVNFDRTGQRALVSLTGEHDGPGYLVDLTRGRLRKLDHVDEARKFDVAASFTPVRHHTEVPEDVSAAVFQLVDAEEMRSRQ